MEQLVLSIKFTATDQNKDQFKQILIGLFNTISNETNFVNAILHEGIGKPEEFLVYETWNDTVEHFIAVQMKQPYAIAFEQKLVDMDIKREPAAYTAFANFGTALKAQAN
jgi:quinol monooxygenase YgiN